MNALIVQSQRDITDAFQVEMRAFVGLLEQSAAMAHKTVEAIVGQSAAAARQSMDQLRRHNVDVVAARDQINKNFPSCEPAAVETQLMSYALEIFRSAEVVVRDWINGNGKAIAQGEAMTKAEYWNRNIDLLLPELWDFESDLFVVIGDFDQSLVEVLSSRHQKRVLFVGAKRPEDASISMPEDCAFALDLEALQAYALTLDRPLPLRFCYLSLGLKAGDERPDEKSVKTIMEKAVMSRHMEFNTRNSYSRTWIDQVLKNLPLLAQSNNLQQLDGWFAGRPAILVAPGPSLEKNIHLLKQAQGRAVVIAQLQAMRRLYREGIRPDFVLVLDPQDLTAPPFNHLDGVPDEFLTNLVTAVTCHPAVISRFKHVFYFRGGGGVDKWVESYLSEKMVDLSGSTTSVAGLRLAMHWRCSPVIVVGQDLAVADGKRYAGDTTGILSTVGMHELPGFFGGTVKSPSNYFIFHFAIENLVKKAMETHPGIEFINCTEGGAFIDGFQHATLQDVLAQRVCKRNKVDEWGVSGIHRSEADVQDLKERLRDQMQSMILALDATLGKVDACTDLLNQARRDNRMLPKLNAEEAAMKALVKKISIFSIIYEREITEIVRTSKRSATLADGLDVTEALYEVFRQGCVDLRPGLVRALDALGEAVPA